MKNSEYWKLRFAQLEAAQNRKGAEVYAEIERQYKQAQKEIEGKIDAWYRRFADNNNVSMAEARRMLNARELAELKWDVNDYIRHGKENAVDQSWMKELENASARFHISRLEALKLQTQQSLEILFGNQLDGIDSAMKRFYLDGYYHTAYELQRGFGIGWDIAGLDQRQIEKVIKKPWAADGKNFSERIWGNKEKLISEVHSELTRNIMLGQDPQKAIDAIAKKMNTSKSNAGRLVMTEEAYFSSAAQKDCFNDLGVEQYEIVATLDSHTSDICQSLDGKVFPMKDFEPGVTAPPFHVNCRSTTVPYFEDDFGQPGERAARGEDGKTYYVPADMMYPEWKKSFVDGGDKSGLQDTSGGAISSPPITISDCVMGSERFGFPDGYGGVKKIMDATTYTTPDGTKFIFPKKYDKFHQTMTPEQAVECWSKIPEAIRKQAQKEIVFVDYYNPADSYWKKHYKNFTRSYATGGNSITFYRYDSPHDLDYVVRTYCHEAGHHIDLINSVNNVRFSEQSAWTDAMKNDKIISGKSSPTVYGQNAPSEDFAESIAEYQKDHIRFASEFPERTKLLVQILK